MTTPAAQLGYYHGAERLRYVGSSAVTMLATIVLGTAEILVSLFAARDTMTHACARIWGGAILWIHGVVVETEGSENLDPDAAYVLVGNHQSALDIPALLVGLPVPFRLPPRGSLFGIPFVGWYLRHVGCMRVNAGADDSVAEALSSARQETAGSISTVIFAADTHTAEGELPRFWKGGADLACAVRVPIVPLVLVNSGDLMPIGRRFADPGSIQLRIGAPIEPDPQVSASDVAAAVGDAVAALRMAHAR